MAKTLTDWVAEYGPVMSVRAGNQVIVVLGNVEVCKFKITHPRDVTIRPSQSPVQVASELMEKEGAVLVDRPRLVAASEIVSQGMRLIFAGSGERFRRLRKAAHTHLQPKAVEVYQDMQIEGAMNVILSILNDPESHIQHVQR